MRDGIMAKFRTTVCAWVGHSRCATAFFGYQYCARCGEQIGDALGGVGVFDLLFVGDSKCRKPRCKDCDRIRASLTWRDTLLLLEGKRP